MNIKIHNDEDLKGPITISEGEITIDALQLKLIEEGKLKFGLSREAGGSISKLRLFKENTVDYDEKFKGALARALEDDPIFPRFQELPQGEYEHSSFGSHYNVPRRGPARATVHVGDTTDTITQVASAQFWMDHHKVAFYRTTVVEEMGFSLNTAIKNAVDGVLDKIRTDIEGTKEGSDSAVTGMLSITEPGHDKPENWFIDLDGSFFGTAITVDGGHTVHTFHITAVFAYNPQEKS